MDKHPINLGDEHHDDSFALRNIYEKSKLNFLAITENVNLSFSHFLHLIKNHDMEKILKNQSKKLSEEKITIPSELLVELTNAEHPKAQKSMNLLSGVFLVGMLGGCLISIVTILIMLNSKVDITSSLLSYMAIGFVIAIALVVGIPLLLAALEPLLKRIQEKHHDFVDRVIHLFQ